MVKIEAFELLKGRLAGGGKEQYRIQTIAVGKPNNRRQCTQDWYNMDVLTCKEKGLS